MIVTDLVLAEPIITDLVTVDEIEVSLVLDQPIIMGVEEL